MSNKRNNGLRGPVGEFFAPATSGSIHGQGAAAVDDDDDGIPEAEKIAAAMREWESEGIDTQYPFGPLPTGGTGAAAQKKQGKKNQGKQKKKTPAGSSPQSQPPAEPMNVTWDKAEEFIYKDSERLDDVTFQAGKESLFRNMVAAAITPERAAALDQKRAESNQAKQSRALERVLQRVPEQGGSTWWVPKHALMQPAYARLKLKWQQLERSLKQPAPTTQLAFSAFWRAALRPPWPPVSDATQPFALGDLVHLLRMSFLCAESSGVMILRPGHRVALVVDYMTEELQVLVLVILAPANAAAKTLCGENSKGSWHLMDSLLESKPAVSDSAGKKTTETQPTQWWFVGMTLAPMTLLPTSL